MAQRDETSQSVTGNLPSSPSTTQNTQNQTTQPSGERSDIDAVKAEASRQFDHVRHRAEADFETARHRAAGFANEQKDYAADQLDGVAGAVRRVADDLPQDQAAIGRYARDLADGLEHLSGAARNQSVGDMVHSAESFGRRQPAAFLGAAVLLGFAASRFMGASASRRASPPSRPQRGGDYASPSSSTSSAAPNGGQSGQNPYGERLHG
jgi:hypothetical protein